MIYFDYAWLPLFYAIHIYGLYKMRMKAGAFYLTGERFDMEKYQEKKEKEEGEEDE